MWENDMVMTILEGRVSKENWGALEQAYQLAAQHRDPGLVQSFLIQSSKDADLWRILTLWSSQAALDAMRSSGETPRGVLIFRSANTEPVLSIFKVAQQITPE
jgi:hypothetical protein